MNAPHLPDRLGATLLSIERYACPTADALAWCWAGGNTENSEGKQ